MPNYRFFLLLLLFSCSAQIDTREFYLTASDFKPSKTYKYQSLTDSTKVEFWTMSNTDKNEVLTVRKNRQGKQIDKLKEVISDKGSILESYSISFFGNDWTNATKFYPTKNELLKWDLKEDAIYEGQFYFNDLYWNLSRKREFYKKTQVEYNNSTYETLVFKDSYKYDVLENQNNKDSFTKPDFVNFIQYSYFSKGIGLVKYERLFDNGEKESWKLVGVL